MLRSQTVEYSGFEVEGLGFRRKLVALLTGKLMMVMELKAC